MPPRPKRRPPSAPRRPIEIVVDAARDRVIHRLTLQARRYPDLDLAPLDTGGLEARDAAFAHAIYDAAIRRWLTLAYLLEQGLTQPWDSLEPKVKGALLAAAAQLLLLDRVPPHAAVNASVEWGKRRVRAGAASMINAVLRRLVELVSVGEDGMRIRRDAWTDQHDEIPLEDGRALQLNGPALPNDAMSRLAVASSHPIGLLRSWSKDMPIREVKRIALHGVGRAPTILNAAHRRPDSAPLPEEFVRPHNAPGHFVWQGPHEALADLLAHRNDVWAQDPASSAAIESIADLRPALIVDVCAGQGTKTRQLAYTFPEARIVATDIADERVAHLRRTFHGHPRVEIVALAELEQHFGHADLVVLDVPCTNTGVLARRVEARYRFDETRLGELVARQRQIIADSVRLLAPPMKGRARGRILYATCSLDVRENEDQARWTDRWHALAPTRSRRQAPQGGPGEPPERWTDGSFSVLLG
jgi:16S rRNA (cytosine967-C5)-methyltransferase